MGGFDKTITIQYIKRLSPAHAAAAESLIDSPPAGWHLWAPISYGKGEGLVSKTALALALLAILDPTEFPPSRAMRLLVDYINQFERREVGYGEQHTKSDRPVPDIHSQHSPKS